MGAVDVPQGAPVAEVELRDADGQVVGTAELLAGRDAMDWAWDLPGVQPSRAAPARARWPARPLRPAAALSRATRCLSFADFVFDRPVHARR